MRSRTDGMTASSLEGWVLYFLCAADGESDVGRSRDVT